MLNDAKSISFLRDDGGAGTAWWVFWMIVFLLFGGVAVDSTNAWRMRAELQYTADAAAHAGVIDLPKGEAAAKLAAQEFAETNMATSVHGDVLATADVKVGVWNGFSFTETSVGANAVMATTRRDATNANRLKTYFLRLIGKQGWDVSAVAVAQRYYPDCLIDSAIIAREIVDFQSNNIFYPGICIHANDHVEVNNGNTWMDGVTVTMPYLEDFVIPSSDWDTHNEGIADSLGAEVFDPKIVDQIGNFLNSYLDPGDPMDVWPEFIGKDGEGNVLTETVSTVDEDGETHVVTSPLTGAGLIKTVDYKDWDIETYEEGYVYHITCNQPSNTVTIGASEEHPLKNVVFIADCNVKVGNEGVVFDAVIGSTAGGADKIKPWDNIIDIGQGTILGLDDDCASGGGVKVLSTASVSGPADTQYYGVQILATQDISIAAQAEGVEGINIQAGGDVDWTSNNTFGPVCNGGVDPLQVPYFRLVM